jgi:hypothetical protein
MGLPDDLGAEALVVSTRRDHPAHARRLLAFFEALGSTEVSSW